MESTGFNQNGTSALWWNDSTASNKEVSCESLNAANQAAQDEEDLQLAIELFSEGEYEESFPLFQRLAQSGHAEAQCFLGYHHRSGRGGTPVNLQEAHRCFPKAAEGGYAYAWETLAGMYESGWGVEVDLKKAIDYYKKVGDGGRANYYSRLAHLYMKGKNGTRDYEQALYYFKKAVIGGSDSDWEEIGKMYEKGFGVEVDLKKAMDCYKKAGDAGYASGYCELGRLYMKGKDGTRDYQQALYYFKKSVIGCSSAWPDIKHMYIQGMGVVKSDSEAQYCFRMYQANTPEKIEIEKRIDDNQWTFRTLRGNQELINLLI